VALLAVHSRKGGFDVMRGSGFHFDETQHVLVPANQVNLPMMPRCAEIPCHHDVPAPAQIEVGVFFTAPTGALVRGGLVVSRRSLPNNSI